MDSGPHQWEAVLCKSTACVNTSTDTAHTDIDNSNVSSLGLEQQHEELCSNTLRVGGQEEHLACRKPAAANPKTFFFGDRNQPEVTHSDG